MTKPKRAAADPPSAADRPAPAGWTPAHVALLFAALLVATLAVIAFVAAGTAIATRRYAGPATLVNAAVLLVVAAPLAGLSWRESHQYADAETLYRTTIARNPGAWMAHHNLAVIKARGSAADMDMAVAHATEAIRLNPTEADAHNTLGIALLRQRRPEEAIAEYRTAIAADPTYAEGRNNLGFALESIGRLDEAITAYREALRLGPRTDRPRDNLARALYSRANEPHTQNRLDEATARYREALTFMSAPRAAEVHNDLGVALAGLGRFQEARDEFQAALAIRPDFPDARANLARAGGK